jgi:hypothetical protein
MSWNEGCRDALDGSATPSGRVTFSLGERTEAEALMETALRISYQGGTPSEALNSLINDHV